NARYAGQDDLLPGDPGMRQGGIALDRDSRPGPERRGSKATGASAHFGPKAGRRRRLTTAMPITPVLPPLPLPGGGEGGGEGVSLARTEPARLTPTLSPLWGARGKTRGTGEEWRGGKIGWCLGFLLLTLLFAPRPALAHAVLLESIPSDNEVLAA